MLFRRSCCAVNVRSAVALTSSTASSFRWSSTAAAPSSSSSVAVAATEETAPAAATSSSKKKKGSIVTATTLHAGDSPKVVQIDLSTPDETATPRLRQYSEPKPFATPKQVRDFTFSMAVGASVIATIHYILSSAIAENYEEEVAVLRRVTKDSSEADKLPAKPEIPQFVAPSSYSALKKRMEEEQRIARESHLHARNLVETPVFHQELSQRVMLAWNNALSNVEQSAAAMAVQYHNWRVKQMKANVKAMLAAQQLELVELKEVY